MMHEVTDPSLEDRLRQIQDEWGMSDSQMAAFCHVPLETYCRWMLAKTATPNRPTLPQGMEAVPPVINIRQRLTALYPRVEDRIKWLTTDHPDLGGHKPIDVAVSSRENLSWVSYYLDSTAKDRI